MLALLALTGLAAVHADSHSFSALRVDQARVTVELRCQSRSLIEALGLDLDFDQRYGPDELQAGRGAIDAYLLERYRLFVQSGGELDAGRALVGRVTDLRTRWRADSFLPEEWIEAELEFEAGGELEELLVHVSLFAEQNPFHRDTCVLEWRGEETATWLFGINGEAWWFEPAARRRPGVFTTYVRLGVEHILGGYDHLAFLIALIVAASGLRSLVGVVTAFTAAHSVTLALAALEVVSVPGRLVELTIAMSIAYVGVENLLFRKPGGRWLEAFGFGLVHGLGFAGFLGESLAFEPLKTTALVGFNLGVELGQVGVVIVAAAALRFLPGERSEGEQERAWLAPSWVRFGASVVVAGFGAWWFCERAGWVG